MKEIAFVLKTLVITLVVVVLMQIKVGGLTLEEHASVFIQESWLTDQIQDVGDGLEKVLSGITGNLGKKISGIFKKEEVARRSDFKLERSAAYQQDREAHSDSQER
jgi:hypothetical protein